MQDQGRLIYQFFSSNDKALLLILDACNWKVLSLLRPQWKFDVVLSRGSSTSDWLKRTFTSPLKDVVYISANPYTYLLKEIRGKFKRIVDVHMMAWNEKLNTVHPRSMNVLVKENLIAGEKKIIVHYLQPHAPFLGDTWLNNYSHDFRKEVKELRIYYLARMYPSARKEFVRAYVQNLNIVLKYVDELISFSKKFDKHFKVAISADHSEILKGAFNPFHKFRKRIWLWLSGVFRFVGHENNSRLKELYEVPWVII